MWKIDEKSLKITMTRGDTPTFLLNILTPDNLPYTPKSGDKIVFCIKKSATDDEMLAYKEIPTSTLALKFEESMTRDLEFGEYVYEISLNNDIDDYHDTFIANKRLAITEELYNG